MACYKESVFLKVDCVEPVYKNGGWSAEETYLDGVKVWIGNDGHFFPCDKFSVCNPDKAVEGGRRQVVKLIEELGTMLKTDIKKLFGNVSYHDILNHFSYEEIVEKLDTWKKEKEEIRVKDEVQHKEFGAKAVVIGIQRDEYGYDRIYAITKKKEFIADALANDYEKTGLHVDDIDTYLGV